MGEVLFYVTWSVSIVGLCTVPLILIHQRNGSRKRFQNMSKRGHKLLDEASNYASLIMINMAGYSGKPQSSQGSLKKPDIN